MSDKLASLNVGAGATNAPSISFDNDPTTGFFQPKAGFITVVINGQPVAQFSAAGLSTSQSSIINIDITSPAGQSYQPVSVDLSLPALAGKNGDSTGASAYLAPVMGNLKGSQAQTNDANAQAGVIGKYTKTGADSSKYPKAGVIAEVGAGTTADAAIVAVISDGDNSPNPTTIGAMYGVDYQGVKTYGSKVNYAMDLQGMTAHAGATLRGPDLGDIRLGGEINGTAAGDDVIIRRNAGAPTNGVTGANVTGPGSLLIDTTNKFLYINTNTKASPSWTKVGTQS